MELFPYRCRRQIFLPFSDAETNPTTPQEDVGSDETTAPADTVTSQGESSREELELEPESEPVQLQHGEELQNEEQIPEHNDGPEGLI